MTKKVVTTAHQNSKSVARKAWKKERHEKRFLARYGKLLKPTDRGYIPEGSIF